MPAAHSETALVRSQLDVQNLTTFAALNRQGHLPTCTTHLSHCRDGYIYVPPTYNKAKPSPLIIMFHPAGKGAADALELLEQQQPLLDRTRTIVLLPESRGPTWDVVMSGWVGHSGWGGGRGGGGERNQQDRKQRGACSKC